MYKPFCWGLNIFEPCPGPAYIVQCCLLHRPPVHVVGIVGVCGGLVDRLKSTNPELSTGIAFLPFALG